MTVTSEIEIEPVFPTQIMDGLNDKQQEAVCHWNGPCIVSAGPGSGKTAVLTRRIAYLIHYGVSPDQILAVTFTKKATTEMKTRLQKLIGRDNTSLLNIGTFHSVCVKWLRRYITVLDRDPTFTILDDDDQKGVIRRILKDRNLSTKEYKPATFTQAIGQWKTRMLTPREAQKETETESSGRQLEAEIYQAYEQILKKENTLDFDDLINYMVKVLQADEGALAEIQDQIHWLLVDEYQDTNKAQDLIIRIIGGRHRNIFVVGDENQSVYAFRGANPQHFRDFTRVYSDAAIILLEQNYRSTPEILAAANALIQQGPTTQTTKNLWTNNPNGQKISLIAHGSGYEEADTIVAMIRNYLKQPGTKKSDIAILYRTNVLSRGFETPLIKAAIPYQIIGDTTFYERREVKDIIAYLRLIANPADWPAFERVINVPGRAIGDRAVENLREWHDEHNLPIMQALYDALDNVVSPPPVKGKAAAALIRFTEMMQRLQGQEIADLGTLINELCRSIGYQEFLADTYGKGEGEERWNNVQELLSVAIQITSGTGPDAVADQLQRFLEEVALFTDKDTKQGRDTVSLLSLHKAKGAEYKLVFLPALEEGILPHARSIGDAEALEEELRLFFVGITRAETRLVLSYAWERTLFGNQVDCEPSRYLADIPLEVLSRS